MTAHYSNALSFLLAVVLFFSLQIEARESKFFTKAIIHSDTNTTTNNATVSSHVHLVEPPSRSPLPSPSPLSSPSEAPAPVESENGYGLYGQGGTDFTNTFDNSESEIPAEEFKEESNKGYLNNKNGYPSNYNEHAYVTVPQGLSDTRFMENGEYFHDPKFAPNNVKTTGIPYDENQVPEENLYKKNNNGYTDSYSENAYVTEPQGLSDTRFMENNKYYYDPMNERNYEVVKESSGNNKGYLNNKNGYPSNYNEHAYVTVPQGLSDTRFMENGEYFHDPKFAPNNVKTTGIPYDENQVPEENLYKKNNNGYTDSYSENAYVTEPQGLSDTRFMENNKYYYDPMNERNYEVVKESSGNNNEGYYGNNNGEKSKYEFDSMEYERQEGYSQTNQGEYIP